MNKEEAAAWLKEHADELNEQEYYEVPIPLRMGGQRVLTGLDADIGKLWPPNESRSTSQRALAVRIERLLELMPAARADLLRRVFWERQPQEEIGRELGISQQAVSQRVETAKKHLARLIVEHADSPLMEVDADEL
jgi:RNA polymerase sigma factor (sigma-70 family)